jgi:hypothetical protein
MIGKTAIKKVRNGVLLTLVVIGAFRCGQYWEARKTPTLDQVEYNLADLRSINDAPRVDVVLALYLHLRYGQDHPFDWGWRCAAMYYFVSLGAKAEAKKIWEQSLLYKARFSDADFKHISDYAAEAHLRI